MPIYNDKGEIIMRKVCIAVLLLAVLIIGQLSVFAAPDTIATDALGDSNDLVAVIKPKNQKDSTFDSSYTVSGYGKEGTVVSFYVYDAENEVYTRILNDVQQVAEDGTVETVKVPAVVTIGASGQLINTIMLNQGVNDILLHAQKDESVQLMKLSITKYSYNLFDIIKSLTS